MDGQSDFIMPQILFGGIKTLPQPTVKQSAKCQVTHPLFDSSYGSFHISLSNNFWQQFFYYYFLITAKTYMIYVNIFYVVRNFFLVGSDKK